MSFIWLTLFQQGTNSGLPDGKGGLGDDTDLDVGLKVIRRFFTTSCKPTSAGLYQCEHHLQYLDDENCLHNEA